MIFTILYWIESEKEIAFIIVSKTRTNLWIIYLLKSVQGKNYKTVLINIKEHLNRWKEI